MMVLGPSGGRARLVRRRACRTKQLYYDYLAIQYLHNAFNSQKITGTIKIFLMALQSHPTSSGPGQYSLQSGYSSITGHIFYRSASRPALAS